MIIAIQIIGATLLVMMLLLSISVMRNVTPETVAKKRLEQDGHIPRTRRESLAMMVREGRVIYRRD